MGSWVQQILANKNAEKLQRERYEAEAARLILGDMNQPAENREAAFSLLVGHLPKEMHKPGGPVQQMHRVLLEEAKPPLPPVPRLTAPPGVQVGSGPATGSALGAPGFEAFPPTEPTKPPFSGTSGLPGLEAAPIPPPPAYRPGPAGLPRAFPTQEEMIASAAKGESALQEVRTKGALDIYEGQKNIARKMALEDMQEIEKTDWWKDLTSQQKAEVRVAVLRNINLSSLGYGQRYNLVEAWFMPPGGKVPVKGWTDPRNPGARFLDDGSPVPGGYVPVVKPSSAQNLPKRVWTLGAGGKPVSVMVDAQNQLIPGSENPSLVPPAYMVPHIRTGEFTFVDDQGNVSRVPYTTYTAPAFGGVPGTRTTPTSAGRPSGAVSAPPPGAATPAPGTAPPGVPVLPPGGRFIGQKGPTGQTKSRADAAEAIVPLVRDAQAMLRDPNVRRQVGVLPGRWSEITQRIGNVRPEVAKLQGVLTSIYSLGGTMHGWRALQVAQEFERRYGGLTKNPDALSAALESMAETANTVYKAGYHRDVPGFAAVSAQPTTVIQKNSKTGQYRHSKDGGVTWTPGLPPSR